MFFILFFRTVLAIESDLTKVNNELTDIIIEDKNWEERTGLKLRNGRKTVEKVTLKYGNSLKETVKMTQRLSEANSFLTNNEVEKGNKKEVSDEIKIVLGILEKSNESGKGAEKLLKAAKTQGDKEAAKYLKFVKPVISVAKDSDAPKSVKSDSVKSVSVKTSAK